MGVLQYQMPNKKIRDEKMSRKFSNKSTKVNNILTVIACLLVIASIASAIFLSGFDWHHDPILSGAANNGNFAELSGTIPTADKKEDWDYFDDTVFVGDSISYGIASYGYSTFDHVFAKVGLSQHSALTSKCVYTSRTSSMTIADALEKAKPGKVILTIGINIIYSYKSDAFYDDYRKLVEKIQKATPKSKIIIQSILPVTQRWANSNGKPNCHQAIIYANQKLFEIAKEMDCYFLHSFEDLCDENGFMISEYSSDGLHLSRKGYEKMFDHILSRPIKSSGKFTKIGAVKPPVVYSPNSSTVSLPELEDISSNSGNESDVLGNQSSLASSDTSSVESDVEASSSDSSNEDENVGDGENEGTESKNESQQMNAQSSSQADTQTGNSSHITTSSTAN